MNKEQRYCPVEGMPVNTTYRCNGHTCKTCPAYKAAQKKPPLPTYITFAEDYLTNPYQPHIPGYPPQKLFDDTDKKNIEDLKRRGCEEYFIDKNRLITLEGLRLDPETEDKIQIALFNFASWISREKEKGLLRHSQRRHEQREEIIKHLAEVVKSLEALNEPSLQMYSYIPPPLSNKISDRRYIQELKDELSRLEEEQNRDNKDYHPKEEVALSNIQSEENTFLLSEPKLNASTMKKLLSFQEKEKSYLDARYTRPKGKPEEFYFKTLQGVVFKLLHENGRLPRMEAYEHTAEIINEAYQKQGPLLTDANGITVMEKVEVAPGSPSDNEEFPELAARRKKKLPDKVIRYVLLYKKDPQYHNLTDKAVEHTVTGR